MNDTCIVIAISLAGLLATIAVNLYFAWMDDRGEDPLSCFRRQYIVVAPYALDGRSVLFCNLGRRPIKELQVAGRQSDFFEWGVSPRLELGDRWALPLKEGIDPMDVCEGVSVAWIRADGKKRWLHHGKAEFHPVPSK